MENKQIILIVDDTPENLRVLGNLLEVDYEVRIATNGIDALEAVKESIPDLILLDILMPGMGGYEVCRQLKTNPDFKIIPIIFISALGMTEQKVEAFREGAVDYITKPFQADEVLARVHTHLQLSKMEDLKHEIAERKNAEELLKLQNKELEAQHEEYRQLNETLQQTNNNLEKAKARAEESDRLKTAFLQNVSHEIRTPLNAIIGFSDLLHKEGEYSEKIDVFTDIILKSSNRLFETVNNILDISKIETGQIDIYKRSFQINKLTEELYNIFKLSAEEKNISLNCHNYLNDDNCNIFTDRTKLYQIFTNLIKNALKFSEKGNIDFGYEIIGNNIQCFVKDNGVGIPDYMRKKMFERFTQSDKSNTSGYEGIGLGLSICKALVTLLGGNIWFESEVNIGTTFYFTLPYSSKEISIPTKKTELTNVEMVFKGKILIVEDDLYSFQYLSELFCNKPITLIHAENGALALECVKNIPDIDMILMDIKMPVMDGYEATIQIKKLKPNLPIIAQSAFAFKEEEEKILSAGCDDFISKPIKKEALMSLILKYWKSTSSNKSEAAPKA